MAKGPRKITPQSLDNAALHYLGRFGTSAENLRRVLMRRVERAAHAHGGDPAVGEAWVEALVERYLASGLLDDRAFAEARASSLHRRGLPAHGIRVRLRQKGVGDDDLEAALAGLGDGAAAVERRAAVNLARRRRLGPFRPGEGRAARRDRDLAALARAGFPLEVARWVVDAETEDDLAGEEG